MKTLVCILISTEQESDKHGEVGQERLIPVKKLFRTLILLIAGLLIVCMIGCGVDDEDDDGGLVDDGEHATPPSGSKIATDTIIYLTLPFAPDPENVTVSGGVATVTGKTIKISGPFVPGPLYLTISWEHRTTMLLYTVVLPDSDAPEVTGGTIIDGDRDVDHNAINAETKIELTFNEIDFCLSSLPISNNFLQKHVNLFFDFTIIDLPFGSAFPFEGN